MRFLIAVVCLMSISFSVAASPAKPAMELFNARLTNKKNCLDTKILTDVMSKINISHQTGYKVDLCNLQDPFTRGLLALMMLYKSDIKMPGQKMSSFDFLLKNVSFARFSMCDSEPGADAFTEHDSREERDIFLCLDKINLYSFIYLMSTFIHEARHLEKDDSRHVECEKGIFKSKRSCDQSLSELKTIGTQYCFLKKIKENSVFTKAAKIDENYYIDGIRNNNCVVDIPWILWLVTIC